MLATFISTLMSAEADAICGAPMGCAGRAGATSATATGTGTSIPGGDAGCGDPEAAVGQLFPRLLLERRRRAEAALTSVVATCYLLGVSTRRMDKLMESLGNTRLSRSQVSEMARDLDEQVAAFRTRPSGATTKTALIT